MTSHDETPTGDLLRRWQVVECVPSACPALIHIAVAFTGRLLADLGATVTRVVPDEDPLLRLRTTPNEPVGTCSLLDTFLNRGKVLVPAGRWEGHRQAYHLALCGDEAALAELALSDIARVQFSTGTEGATSELGVQALVGLTDLFGEPDGQPLGMGGHQTAYATGYAAFCAAMSCIAKLDLHGEVDRASVSAVDALAWVNWKGIAAGTLGFPVARGGQGAEAPVLACRDGYFAFLHLPNNWPAIQQAVDDARLEEDRFSSAGRRMKHAAALNQVLADWARERTCAELYEFCQEHAIPGGPVMTAQDLLSEPLYLHRQYLQRVSHGAGEVTVPGVPLTIEDRSRVTAEDTPREKQDAAGRLPLSHLRVLDLGIFTAGSVTSTLLADLGARVIKVESESYSDPFRIWPGIKGDSPLFTFNNRNKLGVNIDLKTDEGRARFLALVAESDVVVENFRRGVLARLGIDYPVLKAANPNIVLASISGQGASGPGSGHVSFGSTLEAIGGVAALTGYPEGPCYISGRNLNYPDQIVCLYGAGATVAAILRAREAGGGMHIDVSQREVTSLAVGEQIAAASWADVAGANGFPGNQDPNYALQDIFATHNGWIWVSVATEDGLQPLADLLECSPTEATSALARWLATRDKATALQTLRELGVAAGSANTGAEAAEELLVRGGTAFAETASGVMVKGFPFQLENTPLSIYGESPRMGEHTRDVLGAL